MILTSSQRNEQLAKE